MNPLEHLALDAEEVDDLERHLPSIDELIANYSLRDLSALRTQVTARLAELLEAGNVETSIEYAGYEATISRKIRKVVAKSLKDVKQAQAAVLAALEREDGDQPS